MKTPEDAADNKVGRKTPDEIKADAATCLTKPPHAMCDRFDLNKKCKGDCGYVIKELYDLVLHYESRLAQVERERDAALSEWKRTKMDSEGMCWTCKHGFITDIGNCRCISPVPCDEGENWQWRGVCDENTKED